MRAAESTLGGQGQQAFLVLADLLGGIAEIRAGSVSNASVRLASQQARYDRDDRVEANWVAALEGEIALAQGRYAQAVSSFEDAQTRVWLTLNRDTSTVFATNRRRATGWRACTSLVAIGRTPSTNTGA